MTSPNQLRGGSAVELSEFRVDNGAELLALLRQLKDAGTPVQLSTPQGISLRAPLIDVAPEHGGLCFAVPAADVALAALQASDEVLALAYLDSVRLEFELDGLTLVKGAGQTTLRCPLPPLLYRFQRRQAYRVQPLGSNYPRVRLQHPQWPEMPLQLRVLDLSVTGLALLLPPDAPPLAAGSSLPAVRVELERDTHFEATLSLQHVAANTDGAPGTRLGCAFASLPAGAERELQAFIDLTQRRQRLLRKRS
jgi:c-di-GMP-binding flagellar brake protein YcgR